ncbi:hypothetical protein I2F17_08825 [Acinetobacter sp. B10A]|uniref:hypothetical protein n=1 Tax=Acinetobacter baretiae TaxID=2605383 RepID=UPI001B3C6A33|nr:hypothetical protein [Acinetobacter baretiae]MBF7685917.1 hypothetical protein [Acinetobacter baretiae]
MQQDQEMTQEELQKHCIHSLLKLQKERLKRDARNEVKDDMKAVALCALLCLIAVFIVWGFK